MLVYCYYNMRLKIRHATRKTAREIEEGFNPINLDYIFEEDDPLSAWLEKREAPVLDGQDNSWMNSDDDDDDDDMTITGSQAKQVNLELENDQNSSSHSDFALHSGDTRDHDPSSDSGDDNNDDASGGGADIGEVNASKRQDLPPSPYLGEVGLGAVSALFEIGENIAIPRRRRSGGQTRGGESQRDTRRRSRLSRSGSLNSTSENMQRSFGQFGIGESSSSFHSSGPHGYYYPPPPHYYPPPLHYYPPPHPSYYPLPPQNYPPPLLYYPPLQSHSAHSASSSSSSRHPEREQDSTSPIETTYNYLFGRQQSDNSSQSMNDRQEDYEEPPRRSIWWM